MYVPTYIHRYKCQDIREIYNIISVKASSTKTVKKFFKLLNALATINTELLGKLIKCPQPILTPFVMLRTLK